MNNTDHQRWQIDLKACGQIAPDEVLELQWMEEG
jgi:hypothetical protein